MATKIVNAGTEGGFISNISGLYTAVSEGLYISKTSSSSGANEAEAHMWFDTTNAATGLIDADTVTGMTLTLQVTAVENFGISWYQYWGNGAGATFDLADWRIDGLNGVSFDPPFVGPYIITMTGAFIRTANFHVRIQAISGEPAGELRWSYTTKPYLTLTYTPAPVSVASKQFSVPGASIVRPVKVSAY